MLHEPQPALRHRQPSLWALLGWTFACVLIFPYFLFAILWTILLVITPELRRANDWWAWWTISQICIPAWLVLFATTLLAFQRRWEIEPPSAWLVWLQTFSLRSVVITALLGFVAFTVAQRRFVPLALFAMLALGVGSQLLRKWRRSTELRQDFLQEK
jgi:hypothetical protein